MVPVAHTPRAVELVHDSGTVVAGGRARNGLAGRLVIGLPVALGFFSITKVGVCKEPALVNTLSEAGGTNRLR